jgi:hypothetical protein
MTKNWFLLRCKSYICMRDKLHSFTKIYFKFPITLLQFYWMAGDDFTYTVCRICRVNIESSFTSTGKTPYCINTPLSAGVSYCVLAFVIICKYNKWLIYNICVFLLCCLCNYFKDRSLEHGRCMTFTHRQINKSTRNIFYLWLFKTPGIRKLNN